MIHIKSVLERITPFSAAVALLVTSTVPTLMLMRTASADPLTERGLEVTSTVANDDVTAPDGTSYTGLLPNDPRNGKEVGHKYKFKVSAATTTIKGFTIEYCETAFGFVGQGACASSALKGLTGTSPGFTDGFSASAWDTGSVPVYKNNVLAGNFTATANAKNYLTLVNASGITVASGDVVELRFTATGTNYFVNPLANYKDTSNGTYFAHIQTFASDTNASGAYAFVGNTPTGVADDGTVTNNVTTAIGIYTRVQETLNFSVEGGQDVNGNEVDPSDIYSGSGTCNPLTRSAQMKMGDPNHALSTQQAYDAYSYFRLSTNSSHGVDVSYSGDTLKSGTTLDINQMGTTKQRSELGKEQFGLAINPNRANTALTQLTVNTEYNGGDGTISDPTPANNAQFAYSAASTSTPVAIATAAGVVNCDTAGVRYVANIAPDTAAGIYQTKINYIASPRY
jgi:hypothetical protein